MNFLYPFGFLGLIGVPILIAIYIIKNKYTEQVIASTYLWTLSERFLKKRLPINKLVGIISLILQILTVILVSLAVAHPEIVRRNAADDYCFVRDASGSMQTEQNGRTRLDYAKEEISGIIDKSMLGSAYTLVVVGDTTDVIFESIVNKENAHAMLNSVQASSASPEYTEAMSVAQGYFNRNSATRTYLVTDKTVAQSDNVRVINVAQSVVNYALSDIAYTIDGGIVTVRGNVTAYGADGSVNVKVYFDGESEEAGNTRVQLTENEAAPFEIETERDNFTSLKAEIEENDALMLDNRIAVYNIQYENSYRTLIVSEKPFFMQAVLAAVGNSSYTEVVDPAKYTETSGYDLYIYDSFSPSELPSDGAVWFINPPTGIAGAAGFTVRDEAEYVISQECKYSSSTAALVTSLRRNLSDKPPFEIKKHSKCGTYGFTPLVTCGDSPVVFVGENGYGNREVVFAFSLRDSDAAVSHEFAVMAGNLLGYTFPSIIEHAAYYSGDTVRINVPAQCDSIRVDTPSGKIRYLGATGAVYPYVLGEVGSYTFTFMTGDISRVFNVFAALPEAESVPLASDSPVFAIEGEATGSTRDGVYDNLLILFILIAVLFAADWAVYCYEQYQLR